MNILSFKRLNRCAVAVSAIMLLSILISIIFDLSWLAYMMVVAGAALYLLLFLVYQRKVSEFFDAVNDGMEQMILTKHEVELPEVQDSESVFSRFVAKLSRLYDALRVAEANAEDEKRIMQGMVADLSHQIKTPVANIKMAHISKVKYLGYTIYRYKGKCRFRVHAKSVAKMKDRIRELTDRNNGMSNAKREEKFQQFVRGWVNYFKLADMKGLLKETDKWARHRIRAVYWKQWKKIKT